MTKPKDWHDAFPGLPPQLAEMAANLPPDVTPKLVNALTLVLRNYGFAMPRTYPESEDASARFLRAVAGLVNAFTGADPFEGVTAPSSAEEPPAAPVVRVVHTVTLHELMENQLPRIPDGAHVRFELGATPPTASPVIHNAVWCALGAESVEFVGSGPSVALLALIVTKRCAEEKAQQQFNHADEGAKSNP